jgi:molybdate transport system ATP-binding protein
MDMEVAQRGAENAIRKVMHELSPEGARDLELHIRKQLKGEGDKFIFDIAFVAHPGITILFGASGAGKTTLLNCIAGLAIPDFGRIFVGNTSLFDLEKHTNIPVPRRKIGYVLQDLALFPHLSAEENIRYGLADLSGAEQKRRCEAIVESFRISHLRTRKPREISGGERQRVALARTLVTDPCVLLLDEPLAALDAATKSKIIEDLRAWNDAHRIPILYVTHSREEVFALGERVLVLEGGRIIADGVPHEVMTLPRQETIAQLAGFENIFDVTVTSVHENRGTMICHLVDSSVELETPLVRADIGSRLRIGIRAGDILLATSHPNGLSARNIIPGKMISLAQRDVIISARVDCGVEMETHLTLAARDALHLQSGQPVWLVIKTHSCHLMSPPGMASQ